MNAQSNLDGGTGARVRAVIADFFSLPPERITADTQAEDIPGWDSTTHVGLVLAIEEALGIEFSVDQVTDFANVGELAATCGALRTQAGHAD